MEDNNLDEFRTDIGDKEEQLKKIEAALDVLDKMAKAMVELSYRIKVNLADNKKNISACFLRDILLVKDINDKSIDIIHDLLSEGMSAKELYEMII